MRKSRTPIPTIPLLGTPRARTCSAKGIEELPHALVALVYPDGATQVRQSHARGAVLCTLPVDIGDAAIVALAFELQGQRSAALADGAEGVREGLRALLGVPSRRALEQLRPYSHGERL